MRDLRIGKWAAHGALCALLALSLSGCNDEESSPSASTPPPPAAPAPAPAPTLGTARLEWRAPATYTDGAPLTNLAGYRIYYGPASRSYDQARGQGLAAPDPTFTVSGLSSGITYFFAVTAVDGDQESDYSNEASKSFP